MKRTAALLRGFSALGAFALAAACNTVLGIDADYQSVIEKFCQCEGYDEFWLKEITASGDLVTFTCTEYLTAAFEADPEGASAWLGEFEKNGCDKCKNALACATAEPLCQEDGEGACSAPETCCGFDRAEPYQHYCGLVLGADNSLTTRCFSDDTASCKGPLEPCETDADCCGSEGLTARCFASDDGVKLCLTSCDPRNDFRCPGCCATATIEGQFTQICVTEEAIGGGNPPASCSMLCAESSDCPNVGDDCLTVSLSKQSSVKVCVPPQ